MKILFAILIFFVVFISAQTNINIYNNGCGSGSCGDCFNCPTLTQEFVNTEIQRMQAYTNAKDLDNLMTFFGEDTFDLSGGNIFKGIAEIRGYYQYLFSNNFQISFGTPLLVKPKYKFFFFLFTHQNIFFFI